MQPTIGAWLCVDTIESGTEWPFVRVNPAFVRAQFVYAREFCICAGLSTGHKYRNVCAQTESASFLKPEKKSPHDSEPRKWKKRHAQGYPAFDTAETTAYSKHGEIHHWIRYLIEYLDCIVNVLFHPPPDWRLISIYPYSKKSSWKVWLKTWKIDEAAIVLNILLQLGHGTSQH
jgi:hypothetical protein